MAAALMSRYCLALVRGLPGPRPLPIAHKLLSSEPKNKTDNPLGVIVSESCVARLRELGPKTTLRVAVDGGGCSGFQYTFELDTTVEESDRVFNKDGVSVVIDETSLEYLKGSTIEFHTELIRSAFRVVNNPLAEHGCSCGASFNIKVP